MAGHTIKIDPCDNSSYSKASLPISYCLYAIIASDLIVSDIIFMYAGLLSGLVSGFSIGFMSFVFYFSNSSASFFVGAVFTRTGIHTSRKILNILEASYHSIYFPRSLSENVGHLCNS